MSITPPQALYRDPPAGAAPAWGGGRTRPPMEAAVRDIDALLEFIG